MTREEYLSTLNNMQLKLGTDPSSIIMDDIGVLITDNDNMNTTIEGLEAQLADERKRNEQLIASNSNLLRQITVPAIDKASLLSRPNNEDKPPHIYSLNDVFDKNGNFKEKVEIEERK